jgi:hypothetical protein
LEARLLVQEPKPSPSTVIAILRDGLGQLWERHALSKDIQLSVEDEQRIAAGGAGQFRPSFTEASSTKGVWVILLSLPEPIACGRSNAYHTDAVCHYEDIEVRLNRAGPLPAAATATTVTPDPARVWTFADLGKAAAPASGAFSSGLSRGGKLKEDAQLPRHSTPAAFPAKRRPGNPQTHRFKEVPMDMFRLTISPGIPSEAFCLAQSASIPNSLFWPEAQDDYMARVRDGLARHLELAHKAMEMLETVVHLRFGRMHDDRTSRQIIQLWVAAPEKDAFYFLTQIQSLHGVTQISNSLRYMWVVSKETRKLQSPVFDKGLMSSPPLRSLLSFEVLSNFWMRLDRTTERMTLGLFLAKVKAFYAGHDLPAPAIIDAYLLQSSAMAAEPSFMLCLVSAIDLAQLAADL